jgi:tetratricopeptide (TPR) repeat protein
MMVVCLTRLGQLEEAEEHALNALETLERVEDIEARARILTNLALFYTESGDLGMGAQLTQEQIKINQQTKEKFGETIGTSNLGYILLQLGRFKESRQALSRAIRLAEDINARRMKAYGLLNLALAYWRSREPGEGQGIIQEQVFPEFEATQDRYGMGIANLYLGLCYESNNDHTSSTAAFGKALEVMRDINVPGPYMDALAGLVRSELKQGEIDQACERNDELWSFLRKEGAGGLEFPILAYQTCASVFETCKDLSNAKRARKEGYEELINRAERISDEQWRKTYLQNIPEHQEAIEITKSYKR